MDDMNYKAYKKETKAFLIENIDQLNTELERVYAERNRLREQLGINQGPKRPWYGWKFGSIAFDFWPPKDWFRLDYRPWGSGRYAQLTVGPIRIDWADG